MQCGRTASRLHYHSCCLSLRDQQRSNLGESSLEAMLTPFTSEIIDWGMWGFRDSDLFCWRGCCFTKSFRLPLTKIIVSEIWSKFQVRKRQGVKDHDSLDLRAAKHVFTCWIEGLEWAIDASEHLMQDYYSECCVLKTERACAETDCKISSNDMTWHVMGHNFAPLSATGKYRSANLLPEWL